MKRILTAIAALSMLAACGPSEQEAAQLVFDNAIDAYMSKNYNKAKLLLDSIVSTYPDIDDLVLQATDMRRLVYRTEQEQALLFLDSLKTIRREQIAELSKRFYVEDETLPNPVLIHKKQSTALSFDRAHLRAHVNQNGNFYISSHYTGERYINHNRVRATVGSDFVETDSLPQSAYLHRFSDGGMVWEIAKFKNGADNGLANFVARNADKRIMVSYMGEKNKYNGVMTETDKQAIRDTYNLAVMLREVVRIDSQMSNIRLALKNAKAAQPAE